MLRVATQRKGSLKTEDTQFSTYPYLPMIFISHQDLGEKALLDHAGAGQLRQLPGHVLLVQFLKHIADSAFSVQIPWVSN